MRKLALLGASALVFAASLAGCAVNSAGQLTIDGQAINTGSATLNADLALVAAKIDGGVALAVSDLPALCALASNAAAVGAAASTLVNTSTVNSATAAALATADSPVCTSGVTGTLADISKVASSINQVAAAANVSASKMAVAK